MAYWIFRSVLKNPLSAANLIVNNKTNFEAISPEAEMVILHLKCKKIYQSVIKGNMSTRKVCMYAL